jgi:tetratricopeptide (TPR) repeat protein
MMDMFRMPKGIRVGKTIYGKLHFEKMKDDHKTALARQMWRIPPVEDLVLDLYGRMENTELARMEELRYWAQTGDGAKAAEKGLPLADQCVNVAAYAQEAYLIKAAMLRGIGKLEEAIVAYQSADAPPKTLYAIAECLVALGRVEAAVEQLREIELFFKDESAKAALTIAHVYNGAGKKDPYIAELRAIMKKYVGSTQSSTAHNELEAMKIKIGGGKDAD